MEERKEGLDLLALMKKEINELQIKDKKGIKNHIYYRTGEIFNYDPLYIFSDEGKKAELREIRLDITEIKDFNVNCYTWAHLDRKSVV